MEGEKPDLSPGNGNQTSETTIDAKEFPTSQLTDDLQKVKIGKVSQGIAERCDSIPRYKMDYPDSGKRGYAVIINNENFDKSTKLGRRRGTQADERNLVRLFKNLDFLVMSYKDQTAGQILKIAADTSKQDHSLYTCFIMVILSHGDDEGIYGIDETVKTKSIVDLFDGKSCPSLAGKPKIFIFQACRGNEYEDFVEHAGDVVDGSDMSEDVVDAAVRPTIPNASDFLFCYSVTEGFYSYRNTLFGSWYVQDLVDIFEEMLINGGHEAAMQHDILDLLTLVNYRVSRRNIEKTSKEALLRKKQMPCFLSMLTKKLYLAPKG